MLKYLPNSPIILNLYKYQQDSDVAIMISPTTMKLTEVKRQQIVLAAVAEFTENGFPATSMDKVAQRAEVSKRTVYNHFASKDELFVGIVQYMFGLVAETSPEAYDASINIESQLSQITRIKVDLFSSDEFVAVSRVVMPEALHNPERMWQAMAQMTAIESDIHLWFDAAIKDNQLKVQDSKIACQKLMGLIKMEAFWPRLLKGIPQPTDLEKQEIVSQIVGMFLSYYQR